MAKAQTQADDAGRLQRLILLFQKASLSGLPADSDALDEALKAALKSSTAPDEVYLISANQNLKHHRLTELKQDLSHFKGKLGPELQGLWGDLYLQQGKYVNAGASYRAALKFGRTWDRLARHAFLKGVLGDDSGREKLYQEASEGILAHEMRDFAWVELQRGYWALIHGRTEEAEKHYSKAEKAYSGYWVVADYRAELLGAQKKFDEAAALYQSLYEKVPRPELAQALGDLYVFAQKPGLAKPWHEKALAGYLASVKKGEVQYFHHLSGYYADVEQNGAEAVKWARKDLELRQSYAAHDCMAWALYRDRKFSEALKEAKLALVPGIKDAHLFSHAGLIALAAGQTALGKTWLKKAAEVNPHFETFHVHR